MTDSNTLILKSFDETYVSPEGTEYVINQKIVRGIYNIGFENPTNVQSISILPMIMGSDVIIQAQSGMGKTGAFTIGALNCVDWNTPGVDVVIISPTMMLAKQTGQVVKDIGRFCSDKDWCMMSYGGGTRVETEIKSISQGHVKVVVGTPGRLSHLMRERVLGPNLKLLVLDEADSLLDERSIDEIRDIISRVPKNIQIAMFSATMSDDSITAARKLVRSHPPPTEILLEDDKVSLAGISQFKVEIENVHSDAIDRIKLEILTDLYQQLPISKSIVFANTKKKAEWIGQQLRQNGHSVSILHGDLIKDDRIAIESEFRKGTTRILVSSDLLSRGFDVHDLSLVINYDVPTGPMAVETYIHRIGRTGRYGRRGLAISLVKVDSPHERQLISTITTTYGGKIESLPSNVSELCAKCLG